MTKLLSPHLLLASFLLAGLQNLSGPAVAQTRPISTASQISKSPLDGLDRPRGLVTPGKEQVQLDEQALRAALEAKVAQLFFTYAASGTELNTLEQLGNEFRTQRPRTPSGVWLLALYYRSLGQHETNRLGAEDGLFHKALDSWMKERPASPIPVITKALLLTRQAELAAADQINAGPGSNMHNYLLKKAGDFIARHRATADSDPGWHAVRLRHMAASGEKAPAVMAAVEEATRAHPDYLETYVWAVRAIGWNDPYAIDSVEKLADMAVSRSTAGDGDGLYARIYWLAIESFGDAAFRQANWDRMRRGMLKVISDYPDQWNIQFFATFACAKGDVALTKDLLGRMSEQLILKAWHHPKVHEQCAALR